MEEKDAEYAMAQRKVENFEKQLETTQQELEAAQSEAAEMQGAKAQTEAEAELARQELEAQKKRMEEGNKKQQVQMAKAIRLYGRKKTRDRSDVDVDLARYVSDEDCVRD